MGLVISGHYARAIVLALAASVASAQETPAPPPTGVEDSITITGERAQRSPLKISLDFVREVGDPVNGDFGYARLEEQFCVRVHNAAAGVAEFIQNRMTQTAALVDLQVQGENCKPNIDVMLSTDAKLTASQMVEKQRRFFKPFGNAEGTTQDSHALYDFTHSEQPVRWWQITVPVDRMGNPVVPSANPGEPPYVAGANSNISNGMRDVLLGTLIIIDINKLGDASWDQLADYMAMVALVQVDPKTQLVGFETILNLFSGNTSPTALSTWDKAYLKALYSLNLYMMPKVQKGQLANRIVRELGQSAAAN
jgi:hypothetical protein